MFCLLILVYSLSYRSKISPRQILRMRIIIILIITLLLLLKAHILNHAARSSYTLIQPVVRLQHIVTPRLA